MSQVHNAGPDSGNIRKAFVLDLPEITSDRCLFAYWTAVPIQIIENGKGGM